MVWNPYNIAWAAAVVVCVGGLLFRYVLYPMWEKQRVQQIDAHEREKDPLSRRILIRCILQELLVLPAWLILIFGVIGFRSLLPGDPLQFGAFLKLCLLVVGLVWALTLFPAIERAAAVWKGEFKLRRLMASGLMELKGAKGGTYYHYTLGTSIGDRSYDSPVSSLKLGNWYYVALVDGDVVAVLPVSRWAPDLDLRMHMPAGEANRF